VIAAAAHHHGHGLDFLAQLPALIGILLFLWVGQDSGGRRRRERIRRQRRRRP